MLLSSLVSNRHLYISLYSLWVFTSVWGFRLVIKVLLNNSGTLHWKIVHGLFNALLLIPFGSIYHRFVWFWPVVIWGLHNGSLLFLNMLRMVQNDDMEIIFQFLQYYGLQHNYMFDGRNRVKTYITKLKGILIWHFWLLKQPRIVSCRAYLSFMMILENVHLP